MTSTHDHTFIQKTMRTFLFFVLKYSTFLSFLLYCFIHSPGNCVFSFLSVNTERSSSGYLSDFVLKGVVGKQNKGKMKLNQRTLSFVLVFIFHISF